MADLTIALVQLAPEGDPEANLGKGLAAARRAAEAGAELVLFPEMWQIGYQPCPEEPAARDEWLARAIETDDPWVQAHRKLAAELDIAVVATYLQAWPPSSGRSGQPRNAATVFDRHGQELYTYAKVHTCDFWFERELTPGEEFVVTPLDTRGGPVELGTMICYDREHPESARALMLAGAEVVLVPNACWIDADRVGQLRARAFENMTVMAMTNYPSPRENGRSCVFDGMAARERDHCLVEAGSEEGIFLATIDLDELRAYRGKHIWGDAFRRPKMYGALVADQEPRAPFVRPAARRA